MNNLTSFKTCLLWIGDFVSVPLYPWLRPWCPAVKIVGYRPSSGRGQSRVFFSIRRNEAWPTITHPAHNGQAPVALPSQPQQVSAVALDPSGRRTYSKLAIYCRCVILRYCDFLVVSNLPLITLEFFRQTEPI